MYNKFPDKKIRIRISELLPFLVYGKRWYNAWCDEKSSGKNSFSQYGEDVFIYDQIQEINTTGSIYIDVGANHPTVISNTYLLYRKGLNGVAIDPNLEYRTLFRRYRPRDIFLGFGCGATCEPKKYIKYPVAPLNTMITESCEVFPYVMRRMSEEYVPVYTLDKILKTVDINFEWISLLSIDTEGMEIDVIEGAKNTLKNVFLICIEDNKGEDRFRGSQIIKKYGFKFIRQFGCNFIYKNSKFGK